MRHPKTCGKPKILVFDLETTPNKLYSWGLSVPSGYISPENIVEERTMLCGSWMWYGESKVEHFAIDPADPKNDRAVVMKFHELMTQADAWLAHNGDNFDIKWVRTRSVYYGLPPLPPCIQLDTKKIAKAAFNFNSNRLAYLAEYLKVGKKIKTDFDLWKDCLRGDVKALAKMIKYCRRDVRLLPKIYKKLAPFVLARINQRLFSELSGCPSCGSRQIQYRGYSYTRLGKYKRFQCMDCGHWDRERKAVKK